MRWLRDGLRPYSSRRGKATSSSPLKQRAPSGPPPDKEKAFPNKGQSNLRASASSAGCAQVREGSNPKRQAAKLSSRKSLSASIGLAATMGTNDTLSPQRLHLGKLVPASTVTKC